MVHEEPELPVKPKNIVNHSLNDNPCSGICCDTGANIDPLMVRAGECDDDVA